MSDFRITCDHCDHDHVENPHTERTVIALAGLATGCGLLLRWLHSPAWLVTAVFALATVTGFVLVLPGAWRAVRSLRLDMYLLMTAAVLGAWILGEQAEGASVIFLFAFSEWLEGLSGERARHAVRALISLSPPTALVRKDDGTSVEVAADEVEVGQIIIVRGGQRVPLDGVVTEGRSGVNQAPITGESIPVEKEPGNEVFAGTVNGEGTLIVKVTRKNADSTLSRIIQLVGEAEGVRAPVQRFVDRFATIYTPVVFIVALLVAILPPLIFSGAWSDWIYRALALLVIACPCALVIATPVSIVSGLTALVRRGVLVKGGAILESLGTLRALAVDKTGTLTEGHPSVMNIVPFSPASADEVLQIAAAVDSQSPHPIARAIIDKARESGLSQLPSQNHQIVTGQGMEARVEDRDCFVGNHRMGHNSGDCSTEIEEHIAQIESQGLSIAVVGEREHDGIPGRLLGVLAIGDPLRSEAKSALDALRQAGVERIVMLSGDNQRAASAIAAQAGVDEAFGDLLPEDKVQKMHELLASHGQVGMVGDGVNDAPALALATVGIAMAAMGSDTAIETADVALMQDDLSKLAEAVRMGRRTLSVIRFNVSFALIVKTVFLVLAVAGKATLWMAILADTGATLLVIVNSLRLLSSSHQANANRRSK